MTQSTPSYWIGESGNKNICGLLENITTQGKPAKYKVYEITKEAFTKASKIHKTFQELVGYHCDRDPNVFKPYAVKPTELLDFYYADPKREKADYTSQPPGSKLLGTIVCTDIEWYSKPDALKAPDKRSYKPSKK
jgi:hypothetical protein